MTRLPISALTLLALLGCDPAACELGEQRACACGAAEGTQTCEASGFGECVCSSVDAGPGDAAVADGGQDVDAGPDRDAGPGVDGGAADGGGTGLGCGDLGPLRAFPGAIGFGAGAVGGRGGQVFVVDTLDDSGPGSLREAIDATGPRTVVFAVAGTIELQSSLRIVEPHITIAGETAPGGGIALRTAPSVNTPAILSSADEVILRYLRVRPGASTELSNSVDAITVTAGHHIVIAHCSFSWASDENVNFWYDAGDITFQDNLVSEGLMNSTHTYQLPHSKGMITGPENERMSIVRNLFASNDDRSPLIASDTDYELVNNVIYNGYQVGTSLSLGPSSHANLVGNVYLPGPNYRPSRYQIIVSAADDLPLPDGALFVSDNISPRSEPDDAWAAVGWGGIHGGDYNGSPLPESVRAAEPFAMSEHPVTALPSAGLTDAVLPGVGASLPARDAVDTRIVQDVRDGTGGLVDTVEEAGGWPTLAPGVAAPDSDADGMPDAWETAMQLDPNDAADGALDRDSDGYTNLEEYFACLAR